MLAAQPLVAVAEDPTHLGATHLGPPHLGLAHPGEPAAKQEYSSRVEDEDWSAALQTAHALVATARTQPQPVALAEALVLLGEAQRRTADLAGAEASFKEALDLIEQFEGAASRHTLNPLRGIGFTLAAANRHQEAVPYLDRALLIAHRTHGLFHAGQQSILKQLANSLTRTGQPLVAERHVNYMLQVGERTYGQNDPRTVPLICQAGDWHAAVGNFDIARRHYRDAIRLIEEKLGKQHVELVLPLRRLAASYIHEIDFRAQGYIDPYTAQKMDSAPARLPRKENPRYLNTDGQKALLRALDILESQTDPPQTIFMWTLVETGDWFQFRQDPQEAMRYYVQAARIHAQLAAVAPDTVADPFAFPVRVYFPVPSVITRGNRLTLEQSEEVFVQLELSVTPNGRAEDVQATDSNTYPRHVSEILKAMRDARFRPKFVDGEPVATDQITLREIYRVRRRPDRQDDEGDASS